MLFCARNLIYTVFISASMRNTFSLRINSRFPHSVIQPYTTCTAFLANSSQNFRATFTLFISDNWNSRRFAATFMVHYARS
uniref:Putative secreted peptide n=1 Tax=Anopheles braziliensis TaxID=58242 RepID=A0A2M3ZXM7_9DIPT